MRIVVAPDSFKESLSAAAAAASLAEGLGTALPDAAIETIPMADGGEGTVDALVAATGGEKVSVSVTGPLGEPVEAPYGWLGDDATAVIEMAAASGLALVPRERRDPRVTTTRGTGELLRAALERGAKRVILGIGGSATNDGGAGMAEALGIRFLDGRGQPLPPGGAALARLAQIDVSRRVPGIEGREILVACDVTNPLCGPTGASHVYGPQKGAGPDAVKELDAALRHFAVVIREQLGRDIAGLPGAGAAGGLGGGLATFANGTLRPGVELVAEACGLADRVRGADLVVTGEGCIDSQTIHGKTPIGVARVARQLGVPVVAVAGTLGDGFESVYAHGIDAVFSVVTAPMTLEEAMTHAGPLLQSCGESIGRLWKAARSRV